MTNKPMSDERFKELRCAYGGVSYPNTFGAVVIECMDEIGRLRGQLAEYKSFINKLYETAVVERPDLLTNRRIAELKAKLTAAKAEAIEECIKAAEVYINKNWQPSSLGIRAAIRALKEKP